MDAKAKPGIRSCKEDKKYKCDKGCCVLNFTSSIHKFHRKSNKKKNEQRDSAGIAIITESCNLGKKLLLTQSYNNLWGVPKGKREAGESIQQCACREVSEESGVKILITALETCEEYTYVPAYDKHLTIHIFKYVMPTVDYVTCVLEKLTTNDMHEDSTGFGWIDLNCLKTAVQKRHIKLNAVTKYILSKL
jgi:8-oxo-dGTP pyrophosphatase MutT (NUDIX family)